MNPRRLLLLIATLFAMCSALAPGALRAQSENPEYNDAVRAIAKQMNCPTCAGRNLADCPTETCQQWKAEIKTQLDQGKDAEQVKAYFQERFGPTVLQEPPKTGSTLWLWLVPLGVSLMLIGGSVIAAQRNARKPAMAVASNAGAGASAAGDAYAEALERQVKDAS
jgi:cytochrome c-type biogenesis protein CcmH